jgi:hypothetical protein
MPYVLGSTVFAFAQNSISRTTPIALVASPDLLLALQAEYQNTGLIYGPSSMAAIASP